MSEEFTLEDRILCEDDTCIGLIGPDGKCKICGRIYEGTAPLPRENDNIETSEETESLAKYATQEEPSTDSNSFDEEERVLCPDDTCIGIIGPDGKCGTCGKSA